MSSGAFLSAQNANTRYPHYMAVFHWDPRKGYAHAINHARTQINSPTTIKVNSNPFLTDFLCTKKGRLWKPRPLASEVIFSTLISSTTRFCTERKVFLGASESIRLERNLIRSTPTSSQKGKRTPALTEICK